MKAIREVLPLEVPQLSVRINEAFYKNPVFNYIFGTELNQQKIGAVLFQFLIRSGMRCGKVLTYGKNLDNILMISEDYQKLYELPHQIAAGGLLIPLRCGFSVMRRSLLFEKRITTLQRSYVPSTPGIYMYLIAVHPINQRKGIGTQLIGYCKEYAIRQTKTIHLETMTEENVEYYKRRYFKVKGVIPFPEVNNSLWGMVWQHGKDNSV